MFHITFVQVGVFDWLTGRQKGSIFVRMFKNHKDDEAETRTLPSTKVMCFLFRSDKNSGCYGNFKFP